MKARAFRFPLRACLAAISVPACLMPLSAAIYRWDPGLTPSTPSGGNGTWDLAATNWSNGTADIAWPNATGDYAVFAGTAGTVTAGAAVNANRLVFNTTGYTLGGTEIVTFSGGNPQLNTSAGVSATVAAPLGGTAGFIKTGAGTALLTNSTSAYTGATVVNGGILSLGTIGALPAGTPATALTISNGELAMTGAAAGPRTQTVDALTPNAGRDVVTLTADPARPITLTAASLATRAVGSSILARGTGLGTAAPGTAGAANLVFTTAPAVVANVTTMANNPFAATGSGTLGTTQAGVLRGFTVNTSPTGAGVSFATYDPTNGVRALGTLEQLPVADGAAYTAAAVGDNVLIDLTGPFAITGKQTNTLQVNNTSGAAQTLTNSGTAFLPSNGLLFTGNSDTTLEGGQLTFNNGSGGNSDVIIHSSNSGTVTFSNTFLINVAGGSLRSFTFGGPGNFIISSPRIPSSSNGGNYFNGPGNVELRSNNYGPSSAGTFVNGGTLSLGTGFALSTTVSRPVGVAEGATFDIKNIVIASTSGSGIDSINNVNGYGGTVTNSGDTVTNLPLSLQNGSNADFPGAVTGNIHLIVNRQGDGATNNRTQKFTNALTYVGSTSITSASTTSTATAGTPANPTGFLIIGAGGSLPPGTALTLGGKITVNGTDYGIETLATGGGNGVLTLGDAVGPVNQTVASLATGLTPGSLTAIRGGTTTTVNSTLTVNGSADTTYAGILGGTAANDRKLALVRGGIGHLTLSGANNYVGDTTLSAPTSKLTLASTGSLSFVIGTNGVNNKITGSALTTGALNLNGTLNFDLTAADATVGNTWQIVAPALLPATSFAGLTVTGFTGSGVWTMPGTGGNNWVFRASTGALTYEVASSGGGSYSTWASANGIPGEPATGDFDHDGLTNLMEYGLGKSPTASSTPAGTFSGNTVTYIKGTDAIANGDVSWIIQESDDLGLADPWAAVVTQAAGNTDGSITYTLPTGKPKVFVRLVVKQN